MSEQKEQNLFSDFLNNIEKHISNLVNLEVKTIVSDYEVDGNNVTRKEEADVKVISSSMNLIQGDVTTHVSEGLIDDKYTWLREFHSRKEEQGHMIIEGNVKALYSLFELYQNAQNLKENKPITAQKQDSNSPYWPSYDAI
ncbi:hypothetical protein V6R21_10370 [Limibacter armeniacum]|uniref:hypothetical protein n=1 Tax=Limibacter armeniacum TaxID=466084 RepID=UPI002FE648FC